MKTKKIAFKFITVVLALILCMGCLTPVKASAKTRTVSALNHVTLVRFPNDSPSLLYSRSMREKYADTVDGIFNITGPGGSMELNVSRHLVKKLTDAYYKNKDAATINSYYLAYGYLAGRYDLQNYNYNIVTFWRDFFTKSTSGFIIF